jgi:hypothetical protein
MLTAYGVEAELDPKASLKRGPRPFTDRRANSPKTRIRRKHDIAAFFGVNPGRIADVAKWPNVPIRFDCSSAPSAASWPLPYAEGRLTSGAESSTPLKVSWRPSDGLMRLTDA